MERLTVTLDEGHTEEEAIGDAIETSAWAVPVHGLMVHMGKIGGPTMEKIVGIVDGGGSGRAGRRDHLFLFFIFLFGLDREDFHLLVIRIFDIGGGGTLT